MDSIDGVNALTLATGSLVQSVNALAEVVNSSFGCCKPLVDTLKALIEALGCYFDPKMLVQQRL